MTTPRHAARLWQLARAGLAGFAATGADLATLTTLVAFAHLTPREANVPALVVGGVVNFFGNRHFAFRAAGGGLARQVSLYALVEAAALTLNGLLFDWAVRALPFAANAYGPTRLVTSHLVFLCWSYPLWGLIFSAKTRPIAA